MFDLGAGSLLVLLSNVEDQSNKIFYKKTKKKHQWKDLASNDSSGYT